MPYARGILLFACFALWAVPAFSAKVPPMACLLEPNELVEFSSEIPGILEEVNVKRGDWVTAGQVLARLKSGVAEANVALAQARVEFGKRKAQRNEELYLKDLISIHEKDEISTEIQLAQLQLAEAEELLKLRTIRSTVDGVVVERKGAAGEYVGEEPFLSVAKIDPLNVEVIVPMTYFGAIRSGQSAQVRIDEPVGGRYKAQVVIIDSVIDAASGTFRVRLELPNPKHTLPAGVRCQVNF